MARFRAYSSDESDDDEQQDDNVSEENPFDADEEPEQESSEDEQEDSDMHEDELMPVRNKTALVQDDDGDYDVIMPQREPSLPPQMAALDAQRIRVMQTSLFRMPEEAENMRAMMNMPEQRALRVLQPHLNRKHSRDSDGDGMRVDARERASFAHDIGPPAYRPSRKYARVSTTSSVFQGHDEVSVDAGLSFGRSFRVGWGPGGIIAHLGALTAPSTKSATSSNSSIINLTSAPIYSDEKPRELSAKLLQHHLSHSPISPDQDDVPFSSPSPLDLNFGSFASLFPTTDHSYEATLFRLGHALFDPINTRLGPEITVDIKNCVSSLARKAAFSAWLEHSVSPTVESLLRNPNITPTERVWLLLTGNQIERACEAAMDGGYMKLATLIAQAGGDLDFREDIKSQIEVWRNDKVDVHIDKYIRRIYNILAGEKVDEGIDDWKRAFGMHLWYAETLDTSLGEVFGRFSHPGVETDGQFALLRLFADPAWSLTHMLKPSGKLDYSLAWHLYIIISRVIGVRDFADREEPYGEEEDEVEGHSPTADLLTSMYSLQLEQLGLIQEAAFVLLHLESSAGRLKAVKDLMARSAPLFDDWVIRGLVDSLKLPMAWVNEAQAIHALSLSRPFDAYKLYLDARMWAPAHDIAVRELAPEAVIRRDINTLRELFSQFPAHERVEGWSIRGKLFVDYAELFSKLSEEKSPEETDNVTRTANRLISLLPDVVYDPVALDEMLRELVKVVDKGRLVASKGLALAAPQLAYVDGPTRISHLRAVGVKRFLKTVQVN
ncbi:nuclear protein 96-domain-containing protein [Mucidula mucida]|nr:nuclear protein 96-domain-containing protein [Mucidula mucida]